MEPNRTITLFDSAARTASEDSSDEMNEHGRGGHVVIDVTAVSSTPSVVPHIQGFDAKSGKYYDILVGDAITATGTTILKVYPGITPVAGGAVSDILPNIWRLRMVHADGDSITYSAAASVAP